MRIHTISLLLAGSALSAAIPLAAHAQDAQPDAAQQKADAEKKRDADIIVTGTRIVRNGYTAPTPVTVASAEDLNKSTPTSIPDALNKLPNFQNSLGPGKSANNFSAVPIHGNILNLRGLGTPTANPKGPLRTLIMVDGVRVSPTEYIGTVDTNVIPNLLVQRVDVVTGGASAAWGSDAVAGVVNFVLDKNFVGLKGNAQAGVAQRGDNANQRIGLAYGAKFAEGRGHILVSTEYYKNDGMYRDARKAGRNSLGWVGSTVGCTNTTSDPTACSPGGTLNPYKIASNVVISSAYETGKLYAAGNPYNGYRLNANGTVQPFNTGTATGSPGIQLGGDGYTIPAHTSAISPSKTFQNFGRLSFDFSDKLSVYTQLIYSRAEVDYDAMANTLVQGSPTALIYQGNPYLPANLAATLAPGGSIGISAYYSDQRTHVHETTDFIQSTSGVEGKIGDWKVKADYTHAQSTHNMAQSGLWDWKKFFAAVDVVSVNGTPTCRVLTDPSVAAQYAGCQPINLFAGAPSQSSPAGYAYATGTSRYRARFNHDSVTASISGSPFSLPAGPVDIVLGGEYRKQSMTLTSNADPATLATAAQRSAYFAGERGVQAASLYYWLTNVGVASGSLDVKEGFGEIAVPVLKDAPLAQKLDLNGAFRVTDYSTSGAVTTWKVGGTWKPVSDFLLRATYSRDIRAPNLYELYRGDTSGIGIVLDPVSGLNQNASTVSGGNRNLKPEKSKTLTVGGVFTPHFMPGFSMSIDYYKIDMTDAIDSLTAQQILDLCGTGGTAPQCALIQRPSAGAFPSLVRITESNISYLKTSGVDFDASYRSTLGKGLLGVRLYANYLDKFDTQLYAGQPVIHYAGANVVGSNPVAYPHWRGSLQLDYMIGAVGVNLSEQLIGGMGRYLNASAPSLSNFVNGSVPAYVYTDFSVRARIKQNNSGYLEVFGTINNLFDIDPPIIPGITPGVNLATNISTYDMVGRAFTAGVRFKF
ncbi:TonB-dependent receptor domain-containing protein [Novosphingobium rosa]|uniref:TonB-dependent receptor domain-containing protein n=1 Tax=Novosphingobium rosa TaxID=76978 RepID=UPI00083518ED|nr:TonB-dependent receptor [Novosphingobium rosa]